MSYYVTHENSVLNINNAHLKVSGNVQTDVMKLGAIEFAPPASDVPGTVNFTNVTTGVTTTSNLNVGGTLQLGTVEVVATTHTLENTTALGNVTSNTIQFTNATTGIVTTGNVEVGGELTVSGNVTASSNLTVSGNVEVGTANLFVDTANSRIGIGTSSPGKTLDVNGITRSRKTAGWKSGTFDSTGVNMGPMADGTTDGPQIGWEFHITFSAASPGSRVVVYGAYKHSGTLYAASEKWTWRFREGYNSLDYSNYAELVNDSASAHASYYAVIRVVNCLYTNADVGNARHHFMSHSVGTYAGVGASIWQAQGYIDMGDESIDDRFNYLRITSSNGNIKGQWTAFPITT